ncbi:MAG: peptidase M28 [Rhizobiales bacterium 65-9]|nr:M28 family peptidase [Hyphomicrobiales bacterium]OJY39219.1 MAG: peptidase M28 [Rhizobiales bacterium 65-9]
MPNAHDAMLKDVSLDAPWELVEAFAKQPRWKPRDVNKGADMIVKRLQKLGVPVSTLDADIYLSIPFEAEVKIGRRAIRAKTPSYSVSVPDGVKGELLYAPAKYSASIGTLFQKNQKAIAAEDIKGKIVISEGFAFPQKMREFEMAGAVGVIAVNPGVDIHWGICTSIWGTPDLDDLPRKPNIPVAIVNNPDGKELIALAGTGKKITLTTRLEEGWYKQKIPVVEIPGASEPDKFVLLHGHYDSWDVGVGDNATGDATLLEIARVLSKHQKELKRSVRIAWWPGHSTGRYAGSTWFADAFALDLDENCVAQINCDSPGCRWATEFKDVSWMKETESFAQRVIKEISGLESHGERPHRAGDYSFNNIGLSSLMMLSSTMPDDLRAKKGYYTVGGCGGNIAWHTENDVMAIADREILLRDMKVYLGLVAGVADAEVLPFDWRAQVGEFVDTISQYQAAAGKAFDLSPSLAAANALGETLDAFYRAIGKGAIKPVAANAAIQRLARILVPINYTRGPRFRHDPATPIPALPTIATAMDLKGLDKVTLGFAKTQLTRGQTRLIAALREAGEVATRAMG